QTDRAEGRGHHGPVQKPCPPAGREARERALSPPDLAESTCADALAHGDLNCKRECSAQREGAADYAKLPNSSLVIIFGLVPAISIKDAPWCLVNRAGRDMRA